MPRCIIRTSPEERSASRYLARRPRPVTVLPVRRLTKSLGNGRRRSGRLASTFTKRAPSMTGARPRRTVSTSGSSGMAECVDSTGEFCPDVIAPIGPPRYGPSEKKVRPGRAMSETHFGFATVPLEDKQRRVDDVFRSVARRYDLMNDLMSGGLHRAWKDALVTAIDPPKNDRPFELLDVAGGTGDVAFRVVAAGGAATHAHLVGVHDEQLGGGGETAAERGLDEAVEFVVGNAEALPAADRG